MRWPYSLYPLALVAAGLLCGAFGVYAWRRREQQGAREFAFLMLTVALWALTGTFEAFVSDPRVEAVRIDLEYVGTAGVPVAWLAFALGYTGRAAWLSRRRLGLLAIVPLITL